MELKYLLFSGTSLALGIPLHICIMTLSIRAWYRGKRQSPVDLILFALGLSKIISQSLEVVELAFLELSVGYYELYTFYGIFFGIHLSGSCVTTWLFIFYCVKIISFQHRLITNLKLRFPTLIPRLLIGSFVVPIGITTLTLVTFAVCVPFAGTENITFSVYPINFYKQPYSIYFVCGVDILVCLPSILSLISLGLTIASLSLHVVRIQKGSCNITLSQLKTHINAVIKMSLLMALEIIYIVSWVMLDAILSDHRNSWEWLCIIIYYSFDPLQSLILIFGNKKLSFVFRVFACLYGDKSLHMNE